MKYIFFFFKQKTAYEMRISDWSSDVCSSDLPKNPNDPDSLSLAPSGGAKKADFSNVQSGSSSTEADAPKADFSNVQSGSGSTEESIGEQKIGRASCRERVCQYV